MGCCSGSGDSKSEEKGIVEDRGCTDILCLPVFFVFWAGMFIICGVATSRGNYKRLVYGYDSYGFLCGSKNTFMDGEEGPDLTNMKKLYYLDPLELLNPMNIKSARSICVEKCPGVESECALTDVCTDANQYRCPYYRFGDENIHGTLSDVSNWNTSYYDELGSSTSTGCGDLLSGVPSSVLTTFGAPASGSSCGQYYQMRSLYPNRGPCYPVYADTVEYFNRCFPRFTDEIKAMMTAQLNLNNSTNQDWSGAVSSIKDEFGSIGKRLQRYMADITKGWMIIVVAGLAVAVSMSLIWMIILRYCAGAMAWTTVIVVNILFIACTVFAYERSGLLGKAGKVGSMIADKIPEDQDPSKEDRQIWMYVAIAASVVTGLLLLLTLVMIRRIKIAIAVLKVASQAISTMPSILFFPIFPFLLEILVVLYFVFVAALLYSTGELVPMRKSATDSLNLNHLLGDNGAVPEFLQQENVATGPLPANTTKEECAMDPTCYYGVQWDNTLKYMFFYHLFGFLWANQFIIAFGHVVVAGAVANFYWSRGDTSQMSLTPVLSSLRRTLIYHLGSIALGSFLVAVVQFIRILMEYIDRKTKKLQDKTHAAIKYIMTCMKCCLWCIEKIIKFINRNAYIMVAVKGTNFCTSAGRAVALLVQNALRLAAVNIVGDMLIWLGKLAVTAGSGVTAFLLADLEYYTNEDKYPGTFLSSPLMPIVVSLVVGYVVADLFFEVYEMAVDTILLSFCEDCESNNGNARYAPPLLMEAIGKAQDRKKGGEATGA